MENKTKFKPDQTRKLTDQIRETLRYYHYAYRTEQTYYEWIKRYLAFYEMKQHPSEMGAPEIERFLSHLAEKQGVAAATQRPARDRDYRHRQLHRRPYNAARSTDQ